MTTKLTLTIPCADYDQAYALHRALAERDFVSHLCSPAPSQYEVRVCAVSPSVDGDMWHDLQIAERVAEEFLTGLTVQREQTV